MTSAFDEAAASLAHAAEQNGRAQMRNAVMRWLVANRGEISQTAVDSLMAHMERESYVPAPQTVVQPQPKGD